jgi:hypothetical protein
MSNVLGRSIKVKASMFVYMCFHSDSAREGPLKVLQNVGYRKRRFPGICI